MDIREKQRGNEMKLTEKIGAGIGLVMGITFLALGQVWAGAVFLAIAAFLLLFEEERRGPIHLRPWVKTLLAKETKTPKKTEPVRTHTPVSQKPVEPKAAPQTAAENPVVKKSMEPKPAQQPAVRKPFAQAEEETENMEKDFEYITYYRNEIKTTKYRGKDPVVTVPAVLDGQKLYGIGEKTFSGCGFLQKVIISEGIENICSGAFENCVDLEAVRVPDSVKSISWMFGRAFKNCPKLKVAANKGSYAETFCKENGIPLAVEGMQTVTENGLTFYLYDDGTAEVAACENRLKQEEHIVIPEAVQGHRVVRILGKVFAQGGMRTVELPSGLKEIGSRAFWDCPNLQSVRIPEGVTELGYTVFGNYGKHLMVQIPAGVTKISNDAFARYQHTRIKNYDGLVVVAPEGSYAWKYCKDQKIEVRTKEPAYVTENGILFELREDGTADVVGYAGTASHVTIPGTVQGHQVKRIIKKAFEESGTIQEVIVSPGVTEIQEEVLCDCRELRTVTLPATVKSIGKNCFWTYGKEVSIFAHSGSCAQQYCEQNAYRLHFVPSNVKIVEENGILFTFQKDGTAEVNRYQGLASYVAVPASCQGHPVVKILTGAFCECNTVRKIVISSGIKEIHNRAFSECKNLETVTIPATVTLMQAAAFYRCGEKQVLDEETTAMWQNAQNDPWARKEYGLYDPIPDYYKTEYTTAAVVTPGSYAERRCQEMKIPYSYI